MNKSLSDRPQPSEESHLVQWIQSFKVELPKLSQMTLQREAFDFYDKSIANGEPTAARIAAGIMNLPELDQPTAAARRSEWSRSRCVEFLRTSAARLNPELVQVAEKTKSEEVKVAVVDAIYAAIIAAYPHLKAEAADMAVRKKLELARNGSKTNAATISRAADPEPPAAAPEASRSPLAEAQAQAAAEAEADLVQLANTQLAALRLVHGYLVPTAAKEGIVIDSQQAAALTMNMLIQSFYGRVHQKFSRTKVEASKSTTASK